MRSIQRGIALAFLLASGAASAQSLPKPVEFYFDADKTALQSLHVVDGEGDQAVRRLDQMASRDGRNADKASAQLAHLLMASGRLQEGKSYYAKLLQRHDETSGLHRAIRYRYGWDLYRAGEYESALSQWQPLVGNRGINPAWAPPALALALWKLEREQDAVSWYAAAVRSEPAQWQTPGRYAELLPEWTEEERADLAKVQAAWAKAPPAWP